MRHLGLFLVLAVFALFGCTPEDFSPAGSVDAAAVAKNQLVERPFKAKGDFTPGFPEPGSCPIGSIRIGFDVTGTATHLGNFTGLASQCLNLSTGAAEGIVRLQAANGDGLSLAYTSIPAGQEDGLLVFAGEYEATEGTGRFANISGTGRVTFRQDPVDGTGFLTADGVIVF